jgi:phosphocarrier protein HPr
VPDASNLNGQAKSNYGVNVVERSVEVKNLLGLNLGAAAALAGMANKFTSQIMIGLGKNQVSAKSIVQLLILGAGLGSKLQLRAEGSDADEALAAIQARFERRFGEEPSQPGRGGASTILCDGELAPSDFVDDKGGKDANK